MGAHFETLKTRSSKSTLMNFISKVHHSCFQQQPWLLDHQVEDIMNKKNNGEHQLACRTLFESLHPNFEHEDVGLTPLAYYTESKRYGLTELCVDTLPPADVKNFKMPATKIQKVCEAEPSVSTSELQRSNHKVCLKFYFVARHNKMKIQS